ncbi:hypothetical protein I4U23_004662 [Adineta vaga]|nr:hypothetical protein I4U23_004662 [Adineta vaga]
MNSTTITTIEYSTIIYLLIIILSTLGLLFIIPFLLIILIHHQSHTITHLSAVNVSLTSSVYFIIVLYNHINGLFYHTLSSQSCLIVSYIMVSAAASISYALMLQALSQFIFIVCYRYKYLLSFKIHLVFLFLLWLISYTLIPGPCLLKKVLKYESVLYLCNIDSTSIFIIVYLMFTGCLIPFLIIGFMYFYIMFYLRRQHRTRVVPFTIVTIHKKIDRNLQVLRNIMINVIIMSVTGLPSLIITILIILRKANVITTIYCTLFTLIGVVLITITSFFRTKNIRKIFLNLVHCRKIN